MVYRALLRISSGKSVGFYWLDIAVLADYFQVGRMFLIFFIKSFSSKISIFRIFFSFTSSGIFFTSPKLQ